MLMMNIQNRGSKESLRVEFKDGICAELCLELWFESHWYFCNISVWKATAQKQSSKQSLSKVRLKN